ncbi:hypothetical protein EWM64_g7012 [Hericium alpestre]|uniref:Uncharacterized protein n=1 Tax=Hericium alpestre TaxID=135208 RepID=A0A4Y9ZT56_9AGAM|nr:hypothetical protein EWM64_g7012 [Hericium alpestre]
MNDTDASDTDLEGVLHAQGPNYEDASLALIYKHVSHKSRTHVSANEPLPVSLLVYAIHAILEPRLIFQQIPRLLDLLAQVELIRRKTIQHATSALVWQKWYLQRPIAERDDVVLLTESEASKLRGITRKTEDQSSQTIYRGIIDAYVRLVRQMLYLVALFLPLNVCYQHIKYLWVTPTEAHLLPLYLRTYFPAFFPADSETSPPIFYKIMSNEDREEHGKTVTQCIEFMSATKDWEEAQLASKAEIDVDDYEEAAFQALADNYIKHKSPEYMMKPVSLYLKKVKSRVESLVSIFS